MGSALNSLLSTLFPLLSFLYSLLSSLFSLFFFLKASLFCLLSPRSLSISQAAVRNTCVQRSNMCPCFRQAQRFKVLREARAVTSFKTIGGAIALSRTSHFCSQDLGGATFCKTTVDVSFPSRTVKCLEHTQTSWFRVSFRGNLWKSEEIIAERVVQTNYDFAALPAGPPNLRNGEAHTSAHFRPLSAHFPHGRGAHAHARARPCPRTSAHFRTLSAHFPHDRGGDRPISAHFRTLPRTFRTLSAHRKAQGGVSAHFRTLPHASAHFPRMLVRKDGGCRPAWMEWRGLKTFSALLCLFRPSDLHSMPFVAIVQSMLANSSAGACLISCCHVHATNTLGKLQVEEDVHVLDL